jgi:colicin import membrane protein
MTDTFSRSIWVSLMGHGIVAMLLFLKAFVAPQEPIQIRNAIRVDMVGLPDKVVELPKPQDKPAPAPPAAPVPAKKAESKKTEAPKVDLKKKKKELAKSEKQAMEKLKAMDAIEKMKKELSRSKTGAKPVKGNQLAKGNSLTGLERIEYDRYFDQLKSKVLEAWNLPQWLANQDLHASVRVLIDERGYIVKKTVERSSGNEVFDSKAMEAVEASSPLPEPPQRLRGILSTSGIIFSFPE